MKATQLSIDEQATEGAVGSKFEALQGDKGHRGRGLGVILFGGVWRRRVLGRAGT